MNAEQTYVFSSLVELILIIIIMFLLARVMVDH